MYVGDKGIIWAGSMRHARVYPDFVFVRHPAAHPHAIRRKARRGRAAVHRGLQGRAGAAGEFRNAGAGGAKRSCWAA